jgi:hypothetical protein
MDDSSVPPETQSRVRSYLVYSEYEKQHQTHLVVTNKLASQLQLRLNTELFKEPLIEWIVPWVPEMGEEVSALCNISSLASLQAQTDVYEVHGVITGGSSDHRLKLTMQFPVQSQGGGGRVYPVVREQGFPSLGRTQGI